LSQRPKRKAAQLDYKAGRPEYRNNNENDTTTTTTKKRKKILGAAVSTIIYQALRLSVKQALNGEYKLETREAVIDEITNMLEYNVGRYVKRNDIPKQYIKNIVRSFMFIKHKMKADGSYDKTKARLVGNGKTQNQDTFDMISSSTVAIHSVMLLLNIATYLKANLSSYDVKGAFLNAMYDETEPMYMIISKEVAVIWVQLDPTAELYLEETGELILQLDKYIYGLKQAPLKFQLHLKSTLQQLGYIQCINDECIYTKKKDNDISILSTHVDDILQASTSKELTDELHQHLISIYKSITFHERADSYLGMTIKQTSDNSTIQLSQSGYLKAMMEKYDSIMNEHRPFKMPTTPASNNLFDPIVDESEPLWWSQHHDNSNNNNQHCNEGDYNTQKMEQKQETMVSEDKKKEYLSIVMALMYLARLTRADILLPVTYLATRSHIATSSDFDKLSRVLWYLNGTRNKIIEIKCDKLKLIAYCDASYGSHSDGKSHTGYWITMGTNNSYLAAKSGKQKLTAISSTDAEILALTDVVKTILWLSALLKEITTIRNIPKESAIIYQDNKSAIWISTEKSKQRRSRHILIKTTYIKEKIINGDIILEYLSTDTMVADVLTKPLQGEKFKQFIDRIMKTIEE